MIAIDTNILVYAHRREAPFHIPAREALRELINSEQKWTIPWPCVHEFLSIVTNGRIFRDPTPLELSLRAVDSWLESPDCCCIGESLDHLTLLRDLVLKGNITGPRVHDARIAAICIKGGVRELWTADRDFSRFPALVTRNPLVG